MSRTMGMGSARRRCRLGMNDKIDVCRGLFAFLVVIAHSIEVAFSMLPEERARLGPIEDLMVRVAGSGIYWVMGFFVISGYCIQLSVQRLCVCGRFPLGTYLAARATRLLPLYYLALLFTLLVEWWIVPVRPGNWPNGLNYQALAAQVVLIQNLTQTYGSFAPSWSITNEAFYYALYGLLVAWALRRGRRPLPLGLATCLAIGGGTYLAYRLLVRTPIFAAAALLFGMGTLWFLGALVAAHRDWLCRHARIQLVARAWPLALAGSVWANCLDPKPFELVVIAAGLAFALMMIRFGGEDRERGGRAAVDSQGAGPRRIIVGLGLASYPTYLFHGPVIMLIGSLLIRLGFVLDWRWTCAILAVSAIGSGILAGYLLEWPIMCWRAAFLRRIDDAVRPGRVESPVKLPIPATR